MKFTLKSPVADIFHWLALTLFNARKGQCDWGHDSKHLMRMLAMRQALWPAIIKDEPDFEWNDLIIDLAILFHDLDRSKDLLGKTVEARAKQRHVALKLMAESDINEEIIDVVLDTIDAKSLSAGSSDKTPFARLLDDLDKADMGAIGIYRMAATACDRNYGIFNDARDFELDVPAITGDENLNSFAADIKFCLKWWSESEFTIKTPAIQRRVAHRFAYMRHFVSQLKREHEEIGLL